MLNLTLLTMIIVFQLMYLLFYEIFHEIPRFFYLIKKGRKYFCIFIFHEPLRRQSNREKAGDFIFRRWKVLAQGAPNETN